ncbi:hypothetical protein KEJ40_01595 [Candidatus Bathyarchaeota archaeon]|nr:hypothetical protein [Candidatus Bathyarchaeota archaeon]
MTIHSYDYNCTLSIRYLCTTPSILVVTATMVCIPILDTDMAADKA